MATLLSSQTSDTTGSGASHSGPSSVHVRGTVGGATLHVEASDEDVSASYSPTGIITQFRKPGWTNIEIKGTYFVRARLVGATSATSVTVVTTQ